MTIGDVFRMIGRGWAIMAATLALGAVVAVGYGLTRQPVYESVSSVAASNQARVATYVWLARTDSVLGPAATEVGQAGTAGSLAQRITVANPVGSGVLIIKGSASDPAEAARVTAAVVGSLIKQAEALEPVDQTRPPVLVLVQPATTPTSPSGRSISSFALAGAAVGALLGLVLALLRGLVGRTMREADEGKRLAGAPVIGHLSGTAKASSVGAVSLAANLDFLGVGGGQSYLVLEAASDLAGKDAALALAVSLAQVGKRVVLIDVDLQERGLSALTGTEQAPGLSDLLIERATKADVIRQWEGAQVSLIPAGTVPPNATDLLGSAQMVSLVDELNGSFDYVLLSSPAASKLPARSPVARALLAVSPGHTTQAEVSEAVASCRNASISIRGLLLNQTPRSSLLARVGTGARLAGRFFRPAVPAQR